MPLDRSHEQVPQSRGVTAWAENDFFSQAGVVLVPVSKPLPGLGALEERFLRTNNPYAQVLEIKYITPRFSLPRFCELVEIMQ